MELLGFSFLRPLRPESPSAVRSSHLAGVDESDAPRWPIRGWHYHSEHPLELTDVLNGVDAHGVAGGERWESMLPDLDGFLLWCVAQRLNRIEWILLVDPQLRDAATAAEREAALAARRSRLLRLTGLVHAWGMLAGADQAIAEVQQRAWYMVDPSEQRTPAEQRAQLFARVAWLRGAGFDFLATESGTSEFTHPDDEAMLRWINDTADAADAANMRAYIKCHCSTGQTCPHFRDPRTGRPLDFNFLPMLASPSMGVMPHTVQTFAFDDPAPTYGNANFSYMLDFALHERGRREVVYHGETAYWVNFDIDVPLLLPVYAHRRVRDLRLLAAAEGTGGARIDGQMNFHSGFNWGYWLADAVTARASWDPRPDLASDDAAFAAIAADVLAPLAGAGADADGGADSAAAVAADLGAWALRVAADQLALLIRGDYPGAPAGAAAPGNTTCVNGHAYLAGWDTWSLLESIGQALGAPLTQPDALHASTLVLRRMGVLPDPDAGPAARPGAAGTCQSLPLARVLPLLAAMERAFARHAEGAASLLARAQALAARGHGAQALAAALSELCDAAEMTRVRAAVVHAAYASFDGAAPGDAAAQLARAEHELEAARAVIERRAADMGVPAARVASWRRSPTSYSFGYLWTAHTQLYSWRLIGVASALQRGTLRPLSPCYLNYIDGADTTLGGTPLGPPLLAVERAFGQTASHLVPFLGPALGRCLAPRTGGPRLPDDL